MHIHNLCYQQQYIYIKVYILLNTFCKTALMLDIFGANAEEDNKVVLFITIHYDITLCIIAYD